MATTTPTKGYSCSATIIPALRSNPDIAGIGVLISFVVMAYITVLIIIAQYLFAYDPKTNPSPNESPLAQNGGFAANKTDVWVLGALRKMYPMKSLSHTTQKSLKVQQAFRDCILSMSDIQLMTGYGILISGFATLKDGLAAYHWLILVYVAWFSSLTHLASLTFLRRYILEQKFNRLWRLLAIWLLVVILCAALAPTAYFYWDPAYEHAENGMAGNITKPENYQAQPGSYAFCYFHHTYKVDRDMRAATVISILVLISSLFVRTVVLSEKASKLSHENAVKVRDAYSKRLRKWTSPRMLRHLEATYALPLQGTIRGSSNSWAEFVRYMFDGLVCAPLWAIYLVISLTVDFYSSMLWEVLWLISIAVWGSIRLFSARKAGNPEDNTWTFGQILPLILLMLPLMSILEVFSPGTKDDPPDCKCKCASPGSLRLETNHSRCICEGALSESTERDHGHGSPRPSEVRNAAESTITDASSGAGLLPGINGTWDTAILGIILYSSINYIILYLARVAIGGNIVSTIKESALTFFGGVVLPVFYMSTCVVAFSTVSKPVPQKGQRYFRALICLICMGYYIFQFLYAWKIIFPDERALGRLWGSLFAVYSVGYGLYAVLKMAWDRRSECAASTE